MPNLEQITEQLLQRYTQRLARERARRYQNPLQQTPSLKREIPPARKPNPYFAPPDTVKLRGYQHPTPEHRRFNKVWRMMLRRCYDVLDYSWPRYGARGITVSVEWHDYRQFLTDMWPRPSPQHSIDRIDNNGPYSKANCRWATAVEQSEYNKEKL